jgi:hypothetical protein
VLTVSTARNSLASVALVVACNKTNELAPWLPEVGFFGSCGAEIQ